VNAQSIAIAAGAALCVWFVLPLLARIAHARGWVDPHPRAPIPDRKRGQPRAPTVGGIALLGAAAFACSSGAFALSPPLVVFVCTAFLAGWIDDRTPGGLSPKKKILAQLVAALPLAAHTGIALCEPATVHECAFVAVLRDAVSAPPSWHCALVGGALTLVLAIVCFNVVNTWDHADGVAATFTAVAFASAGAPLIAGSAAGLLARQLRPPRSGTPYLGDAGSHLVAALVLVTPATWLFLWLPALDLVRVVAARLADGQSAFEGDRRHLGAALMGRGLSPARTALLQALLLAATAFALGQH